MVRTPAAVLAAFLIALPALAQTSPQRPPGLKDRLVESMLNEARRAQVPEEEMPAWRRAATCTADILTRSNLTTAVLEQAIRDRAAGRENAQMMRRTDLRDEVERRCIGR